MSARKQSTPSKPARPTLQLQAADHALTHTLQTFHTAYTHQPSNHESYFLVFYQYKTILIDGVEKRLNILYRCIHEAAGPWAWPHPQPPTPDGGVTPAPDGRQSPETAPGAPTSQGPHRSPHASPTAYRYRSLTSPAHFTKTVCLRPLWYRGYWFQPTTTLTDTLCKHTASSMLHISWLVAR